METEKINAVVITSGGREYDILRCLLSAYNEDICGGDVESTEYLDYDDVKTGLFNSLSISSIIEEVNEDFEYQNYSDFESPLRKEEFSILKKKFDHLAQKYGDNILFVFKGFD